MAAEIQVFHNAANALKAEGYTMDMPVYIDYEDARLLADTSGLDYNSRTALVRYGMVLLEQHGYYPGFYTCLLYTSARPTAALWARRAGRRALVLTTTRCSLPMAATAVSRSKTLHIQRRACLLTSLFRRYPATVRRRSPI